MVFFSSPPQGQNGRRGLEAGRQVERQRRQTPGTPQGPDLAVHQPHDRVVHPVEDLAIVQQQGIRQSRQPLTGLVVGDARGFLAAIAAGHDQRTVPVLQQKPVQGTVGEHEAQGGLARRDIFG